MSTISIAPTLFLIRHARAGGPRPGERDIDRSLDGTGKADAERIGGEVLAQGWSLGDVACSPALRCRQTAERLLHGNPPASLTIHDSLYTGTLDDYLAFLRQSPSERPLTLVGHNPVIEQLVWEFLGADGAAQALPAGFQPGTVVAIARLPDARRHRLVGVLAP